MLSDRKSLKIESVIAILFAQIFIQFVKNYTVPQVIVFVFQEVVFMQKQSEFLPDDLLTGREYRMILAFLHAIHAADSTTEGILHSLNKYFGYISSSFWVVNEDFSMSHPKGANLNTKLMEDYAETLHVYDAFGIQNMSPRVLMNADVLDYDKFVAKTDSNPYTNRLKEEKIHHKYSIIVRSEGKIKGAIALFEPIDRKRRTELLDMAILAIIAPFISQEFENHQKFNKNAQIASIFKTVINTEVTGIILFKHFEPENIIYNNPVSTRYCVDFLQDSGIRDIIPRFINDVVKPFDRPFPTKKDLNMDIPAPGGKMYHLRILDNGAEQDEICTVFIVPADSCEENTIYGSLFSRLTPREREITLLISQGMTNSQIAKRLFVSIPTVKSHIEHIFKKAGVTNRTSLTAMLYESDQ